MPREVGPSPNLGTSFVGVAKPECVALTLYRKRTNGWSLICPSGPTSPSSGKSARHWLRKDSAHHWEEIKCTAIFEAQRPSTLPALWVLSHAVHTACFGMASGAHTESKSTGRASTRWASPEDNPLPTSGVSAQPNSRRMKRFRFVKRNE